MDEEKEEGSNSARNVYSYFLFLGLRDIKEEINEARIGLLCPLLI